ncbi:hypothetical protein [Staphylococcus warneri]|uniref:hypothetical protein n=1 Tax=Staphylococcus warneri TaxID=1292 RepID=UPI003B9EB4C4
MNEVQKRIEELQSFYDRICEVPLLAEQEVLPAAIDWLVGEITQLKALLRKEKAYVVA